MMPVLNASCMLMCQLHANFALKPYVLSTFFLQVAVAVNRNRPAMMKLRRKKKKLKGCWTLCPPSTRTPVEDLDHKPLFTR